MDNYQKLEQLVNKAGCSYEDAKAALEACGWDMIDAIVSLEREGKVKKETAAHNTDEVIEVTAEVATGSKSGSGSSQSGSSKNAEESRSDAGSGAKKEGKIKRFWNRLKSIVMNNRMVIIRSNGTQLADLPILAPIIALLLFFWATLGIAVLAMVFGFRFHFEGEDLGKTNINNTMDKATDYAEKVREDLTGKAHE